MKIMFVISVVVAMFSATAPRPAALALIVTPAGELIGATGVDVLGDLYDVEFLDGTCVDLFSGCDGSSFTFTTEAAAFAASTALMDDGFIDNLPFLTRGCTIILGDCAIVTPYSSFFGVVGMGIFLNDFDPSDLVGTISGGGAFDDTGLLPEVTYTRWTLASPSARPWPPSQSLRRFVLLGSGLAGLLFVHRRRIRKEVAEL